jgi:phenazine biosynthesis protein phzE
VLTGDLLSVDMIGELPSTGDVLALLPFRLAAQRGFRVRDDGAPLLAMRVGRAETVGVQDVVDQIPDVGIRLSEGRFDTDDESYAQTVRDIIGGEIGSGEGSNFVIKRSYLARINEFSPAVACALFRRLLLRESGAYWTFLFHTPRLTLVGASPERHVSLAGGVAVMNPISGTYRYPPDGPQKTEMLAFLGDTKESDELYMVLDEELKMMTGLCEHGAAVTGPHLKEMAHLAHTEYFIHGETSLDAREVLARTLFAPTVTGSPIESAFRAIHRHEPQGRGYYAGAIALLTADGRDRTALDSAILIRTAEITPDGDVSIAVGATLVRHSCPEAEVAETKAKAATLLSALTEAAPRAAKAATLGDDPEVLLALRRKNESLAPFWLRENHGQLLEPDLCRHRVLIVDAEDAFTGMLAHQIRTLGPKVDVSRYDRAMTPQAYDLVVIGPGPGDPRDDGDYRIASLSALTGRLLACGKPLLAVCLGHQILCRRIGLPLARKAKPNQGTQLKIDLFGSLIEAGFYNTFTAMGSAQTAPVGVQVCADPRTGEVYALRGNAFRSFQFHPESVLSPHGLAVVRDALCALLPIGGSHPWPIDVSPLAR